MIAGKGHETKQIFKNKIINISDKQIVKKIKFNVKKFSENNQNISENKKILSRITKRKKIKNFHGVAIDSRNVKKDNIFLTIKGKNNDGAKFIYKAIKKGAKYIISSKLKKKFKNKTIKVDNEMRFLNSFAYKKREHSKAKILAITGSAGKNN